MDLPHKISTLLYAFNEQGEILLLKRTREPNRGRWSPPGGKLKSWLGESPYACACREAAEEMKLAFTPSDLHLTGLISEAGYQGNTHWLMFLFEVRPLLRSTPEPHPEGTFAFFRMDQMRDLLLPDTDRDFLWPRFWEHRGGFFAAHAICDPMGKTHWTLEESLPAKLLGSVA